MSRHNARAVGFAIMIVAHFTSCSTGGNGVGPAEPPAQNLINVGLLANEAGSPVSAILLKIDHQGTVAATNLVPGNFFRVRHVSGNEMHVMIVGNLTPLNLLQLTGDTDGISYDVQQVAQTDYTLGDPSAVSLRFNRRE